MNTTETKPKKAILCVDDEVIILMSLKSQIRKAYKDRFIIETSLSGEDAIPLIDSLMATGVNVIILISDWHMPSMKGDELFKLVSNKYPKINLLMITGQAEPSTLETLKKDLNNFTVFYKPWEITELLNYIDQADSKN